MAETYSVEQAAQILDCERDTVIERINAGDIPGVKLRPAATVSTSRQCAPASRPNCSSRTTTPATPMTISKTESTHPPGANLER